MPLAKVNAAPARVNNVGISRQKRNPHKILMGSEAYSNGAMTDACAML